MVDLPDPALAGHLLLLHLAGRFTGRTDDQLPPVAG